MKIQTLVFVVVMAFPILAQGQMATPKIVGPQYPIIQQRSDYQHKENQYCGGYFVLEAGTQYGGPYLLFYYRDSPNTVASDEIPLKDVSLVVVPDPAGAEGLPKATIIDKDGGQNVWVISVTEKMLKDYTPCLKSVPLQSKP